MKELFLVSGAIWIAFSYLSLTPLLLWPAAASVISGIMLYLKPDFRLSSSLAKSTAIYGIVISVLQLYFSISLINSAFSTVAIESTVVFILLFVLNAALLYAYNNFQKLNKT